MAITGPTGTFGHGLMPLLQADVRVARIVGVARRPFDPAAHGWTKLEYRQGDVRDEAMLEQAFAGADVVVHLAFLIAGTASREATEAINVEGTLRAFRAASASGATRFVYASSVAAYGFHADNPIGMSEEWPVRPAKHLVLCAGEGGSRVTSQGGVDETPRDRAVSVAATDRVGPTHGRGQAVVAGGAHAAEPRPRRTVAPCAAALPGGRPDVRTEPASAVHPRGRRR